jgi:hypothetical protein
MDTPLERFYAHRLFSAEMGVLCYGALFILKDAAARNRRGAIAPPGTASP